MLQDMDFRALQSRSLGGSHPAGGGGAILSEWFIAKFEESQFPTKLNHTKSTNTKATSAVGGRDLRKV